MTSVLQDAIAAIATLENGCADQCACAICAERTSLAVNFRALVAEAERLRDLYALESHPDTFRCDNCERGEGLGERELEPEDVSASD